MLRWRLFLLAWITGAVAVAAAPQLRLSLADDGVDLDAGEMGKFNFSYPRMRLQQEDRFRPVEAKREGDTVTIKYRDGGVISGKLSADRIRYTLTAPATGFQGTFYEMYVPFNYNQGGSWSVDGRGGPFPLEKVPGSKIFQGHGRVVGVADANCSRLLISVPEYTYLEVQDNREWNWNIFWIGAHLPNVNREWEFVFTVDNGEFRQTKLVDRYGQVSRDFPDKIKSDDELKADAETDGEFYRGLDFPGRFTAVHRDLCKKMGGTPDVTALDRFGGLAGSGRWLGLKNTGYFHIDAVKIGGTLRQVLVDPDGNLFFHLGICGFGPSDDFTSVEKRENSFEWLPPRAGPFAAAWKDRPGDWWNTRAVSFYKANVIRKFGEWDDAAMSGRYIDRVRQAGFNSIGAFSPYGETARQRNFPYVVSSLPTGGLRELKGVRGMFDPFDPEAENKLDAAMAKAVAPKADDPLLIGYFLANEQALEDIPRAVAELDGSYAAKRALVDKLRAKYGGRIENFNTAWEMRASSFDDLLNRALPVTSRSAFGDVREFSEMLLEAYYGKIEKAFRRHDRNHLLIGSRWQPGTANDEILCRVAGMHLDVISINYYTAGIDEDFVRRIHRWTGGKPQFWSEFYYTAAKASNCGPSNYDLGTQRERGKAYRNYVEGAAALGFVVGIEWFTLIDQAATGRFFEGLNGERCNTGLFSVTDRPYRDLLDEMTQAHLNLYPVFLGLSAPYKFDDPRYAASAVAAARTVTAGHATAEIKTDGRQDGYPLRPPERIPSSRLVLGRDANGLEALFKVAWDENFLHLLVNVKDRTPMCNRHKNGELWNGDAVELFIGTEQPERGGAMLFSDRQVLIGAADGSSFVPNVSVQPAIRTKLLKSADGEGYVLEAAIPWKSLDFKPQAGAVLLFDLAVDDAPVDGDRAAQLMWNGGGRNSSDRLRWGRLLLVQ